jgi:hypothetical protein
MSVSFHFSLYYTGDLLMFEVALLIPRDSTDEVLHASSNHFYMPAAWFLRLYPNIEIIDCMGERKLSIGR